MKILSALVVAFFATTTAHAQTIPKLHVFGETATPAMADCGLTYESALSTAKAALRYNRIEQASQTEYLAEDAWGLYVNLNAIEVANGVCAVSYSVKIQAWGHAVPRATGVVHYPLMVMCERGGLASGRRLELQTMINSFIRDRIDVCIADYLEMAKLVAENEKAGRP